MSGDFRIGQWLVDPSLNTVSANGASRHLEPKVMAVLVCLAKAENAVVPKQRLIDEVWKDTFVTDDVLTRCISELRDAFGDDARNPAIIQTIPKVGYKLLVPVLAATSPGQTRHSSLPSFGFTSIVRMKWWLAITVFITLVAALIYLTVFRSRIRNGPPS